jgi:hypothetical protein
MEINTSEHSDLFHRGSVTKNLVPIEEATKAGSISTISLSQTVMSAFRPRGVPGPTSKLSLRAPAQMGRHETEHKEGKTAAPCCPAPRVDALAVGGYKRSRGRGRESLSASPSSRAATFSYEGPGPSFYRCKERVQVYNGGCSNMLTCPAERSQSPMYMPTWLSERC